MNSAGAVPVDPAPGAPVCPSGYRIRARRRGDDDRLVAIENVAGRLFADHGFPQLAEDGFVNAAEFRRMIGNGAALVAVDALEIPVGYAVTQTLGGYCHLRELAVHPNHGRRGVGRALVGAVIAAARKAVNAGVSLSTFRDLPFNRPFYESVGFRELPLGEAPEILAESFRREVPHNIDPASRLLMFLPLPPPGGECAP